MDVCYFGDFLADCTRVNHECISHHHFGRLFCWVDLFHPHRRCKFLSNFSRKNFSLRSMLPLTEDFLFTFGSGLPRRKNGPIVMFLLAKEEGNPRIKTTKTKGLYGSPIVYFERSPPKTRPVPAVRFRGCTTEMCCPKNQP